MNSNMINKQKLMRNGFDADFNANEDDFVLADLDVMLDEVEPSPVLLKHFLDDEDTIDLLLVDSGFNDNAELEEEGGLDTQKIDDIDFTDDFSGFDQFIIEPINQAEQNPLTEADKIAVSDIFYRADFDGMPDEEDAIDRLLVDSGFNGKGLLDEGNGKSSALVIGDIGSTDEFVSEPVEPAEKNLLAKADEISAIDIFSMTDFDEMPDEEHAFDQLLVDAGLDASDELKEDDGMQGALWIDDISKAKEFAANIEVQSPIAADAGIFAPEPSKLAADKEVSNVLLIDEGNPEAASQKKAISEATYQEGDFEVLKNNAGISSLSSVGFEQEVFKNQLNDYQKKLKKAAIITYTSLSFGVVALLSTVVMGVIVSGVQTKVSKLTELVSIFEDDMIGIAEKNTDIEINNSDFSIEQLNQKISGLPEQLEKQAQFSSGAAKKRVTAVATKQTDLNKSINSQKIKTHGLEKTQPSKVTIKKVLTEKKASITQATSDWSVNLTAYEDLSYAKSKAAKFIQKDIPVKVVAVDMNNAKWYRLKVVGFKNKKDATSYAAKIKKSLNLNTVFVGNS